MEGDSKVHGGLRQIDVHRRFGAVKIFQAIEVRRGAGYGALTGHRADD